MEASLEIPKRKVQEGKFHEELPKDLEPLKKKYETMPRAYLEVRDTDLVTVRPTALERIQDADMVKLLEQYATQDNIDLTSLCECFGISLTTLQNVFKSPKWRDAYQAAKKARSSMLLRMSLESASMPYEMLMNGNEIHPLLVKAAQLRSNQCLAIAKVVDPDLAPSATQGAGPGTNTVNIQVNAAVPVKDF